MPIHILNGATYTLIFNVKSILNAHIEKTVLSGEAHFKN